MLGRPWSALLASVLLLGLARSAAAATGVAPQDSASRSSEDLRDAELRAFLAHLAAWRAGDEDAGPLLAASGERLAGLGRPDARDVAAVYLALDTDARRLGLEDEASFDDLRERLRRAGEQPAAAWPATRATLLADLDAAAAAWVEHQDRAPRARVLALAARVRVDQAQADRDLDAAGLEVLARCAERDALASLALFERAGQRTPRLEPLWVLGEARRVLGDVAGAARAYEATADLATELGRTPWCSRAWLGLVALARDTGDVAAVDRLLARLATVHDARTYWPLAREQALRLLHADRGEDAVDLLESLAPVEPREQEEHGQLLAASLVRIGRGAEALQVLESLDPAAADGEAGRLVRGALELARGRGREALVLLAPEAFHGEAARAQASTLRGAAYLALGDAPRARQELDHGLELAEAWRVRHAGDGVRGGSVTGEWLGVQGLVWAARARSVLGDPLGAALLLEEHQARDLRPGRDPGPDAEGLRAWAARGAGLLVLTVGADDGLLVHVDASGDAWSQDLPVGRRALERAVRRLREAAMADDGARVRALGEELGSTLFPPELVERLLDAERADDASPDLLVLLHGSLEAVPLALLAVRDRAGRVTSLEACVTLRVLPGLPAPRPGSAGTDDDLASPTWLLLGAPILEGERALPAAARELAHLARLHPDAELRSGAAFTVEALRDALARGARLHLATHLVRDDACGARAFAPAGLCCTDGVLCSEELRLRAAPRDLVVLDACGTGDGRSVDGEGLMGLGRAFLASGTRNALVTLWPVEDGAAESFARAFHAALLAGERPSRAARSARAVLTREGYGPSALGAFRLLGRD